MSDIVVVTCAGCGKRYKGSTPGKKFKCSECLNLFTFPDQPHAPLPGHTCCTNCWTENPIDEKLKDCPNCTQKLSPRIVGKASSLASISQAHQSISENELQNQIVALMKERDELIEQRKQQDRTMGSLLEQVAFAKSQGSAQQTQAEDSQRWELQMEVGELKTKVSSLQEDLKKVAAERDAAGIAALTWEEKYHEMQSRTEEFAAKMAEMETRLNKTPTVAIDPKLVADIEVQHTLEARVSELEMQVAQLEETNASVTHDRDDARAKAMEAESNLEHFRQAAVQALTPLGVDCSKSIKRLTGEAEAEIEKLREHYREAAAKLDQELKASGEALKDHLKKCRRELVDRFAEVLGTPAEISTLQPAVQSEGEAQPPQEHPAEHAA